MKNQNKPFLRWAGSKRKQLTILAQFWKPEFCRYVEPFMGSACLFFELQPSNALLSDINGELTRTFLAIRNHPKAVSNRLAKMVPNKRNYYVLRNKHPSTLDDLDAAARFIFLNRFCFNGLYRTNKAGVFNVPYGGTEAGQLPCYCELALASQTLRKATILNSDFEEILSQTKAGDFVYLDPPYAVDNRRIFRQYAPHSFGLGDLQRLADQMSLMDQRGVKFLLSYAFCSEAMTFFKHWPHRRIYVQRNIAGFATHRRRAGEVLVSNCFTKFTR